MAGLGVERIGELPVGDLLGRDRHDHLGLPQRGLPVGVGLDHRVGLVAAGDELGDHLAQAGHGPGHVEAGVLLEPVEEALLHRDAEADGLHRVVLGDAGHALRQARLRGPGAKHGAGRGGRHASRGEEGAAVDASALRLIRLGVAEALDRLLLRCHRGMEIHPVRQSLVLFLKMLTIHGFLPLMSPLPARAVRATPGRRSKPGAPPAP